MSTMDELAAKQQIIGEEIQKLIRNYKKDSIERKNIEYFNKRIIQLNALKCSFEENDDSIRKLSHPPLDHSYFTEGYYDKISGIVEAYLMEFENRVTNFKTPEENSQKNSQPDNSCNLIRQLKATLSIIQRRCDAILKTNDQHSKEMYDVQLNFLRDYWQQLQALHMKIWEKHESPALFGYNDEEYIQVEEKLHEAMASLASKCNSIPSIRKNDVVTGLNAIQLPKITVPKFHGDYLKWQQFHDLFTEMIDKQQIPQTQKMWYLSTSLSGEAAKLICHLPITTKNYEVAWQIITERYNNKRAIVSSIIKSMVEQTGVGHKFAAVASELQAVFDNTREGLLALNNIGVETETWGPLLIHLLLPKLDRQTRMLYEQSLQDPKLVPDVNELLKFLEHRFQSLEIVGQKEKSQPAKSLTFSVQQSDNQTCKICKKTPHALYKCEAFLSKSVPERQKVVRSLNVCFNCLRNGHQSNECPSRTCTKCNRKHNTLLHQQDQEQKKIIPNVPSQIKNTTLFSTSTEKRSYVLLGTALINITDANGKQIKCRAMLDSGSQVNLITEDLVKKLKFKTKPLKIMVEGIGHAKRSITSSIVTEISSLAENYVATLEALVLPRITSMQPHQNIHISNWKLPKNITLADPDFHHPGNIDILLGAEFYNEISLDGKIKMSDNLPSLQNTKFGWVCIGKISELPQPAAICGIYTNTNEELNTTLTKFWQLEDVGCTSNGLTEDEMKCESLFAQDTKRNSDGRFIVKLPFSQEPTSLGNSYQQAVNRFFSLEQRLSKQPQIKQQYIQFMREYEELGHMEKIKKEDITHPCYFIPHHCVLKPDSSTTKLRVVFDASAKTSTGLSLNDIMYNGPVIQSELTSILLRFRLHRFVFTTDIEKMYRQVLMDKTHQQYQLIVWRENPDDRLGIFKLKTVTYGTRSAPFLAIRCLKSLAEVNKNIYPFGAKALKDDFYVDDGLTGADTMVEALKIKQELSKILSTAGLKLRKWCANNAQLLSDTPVEDQEIELDFTEEQTRPTIKTLGILWLPKTDEFRIKTSTHCSTKLTKRIVTSELARIFDPLGLVAPVTITAKILIQNLWQMKVDWDDILPLPFQRQWIQFQQDLQELNNLKIPRHINNHKQTTNRQLHVFTDASQKAYGAAVYIRITNQDGTISSQLLCAKSRVCPLKTQTIPRLELCAALLGVELMTRVKLDMNLAHIQTFMWTDSEIVLHWINSESCKYQTFVAHRIAKIQEMSLKSQWRHIDTKNNPADLVSRGVNPKELSNCSLWFYGPFFLHGNEDQWPTEFKTGSISYQATEEKQIKTVLSIAPQENFINMIYNINHKNSFTSLQRIVCYMLRFVTATRNKTRSNEQTVSPTELRAATNIITRAIQESEFHEEIKQLSTQKMVDASNSLVNLTPFLDCNGIIRVGGRLQAANVSFDSRHPILLPYNDPIVKLLMRHLHETNSHCGPQALLATTRQQFWPIKGKIMARSIVQHCTRCTRMQPKLYQQVMGNLPADRVQLQRPFFNSGVDFCGPIWIHHKLRGKRPCKAYISVFCCFATKAVHLEIVSDLTTAAFLGALNRFISRRGRCQKLYCDNATNFVGAKNQLTELSTTIYSKTSQNNISNYCTKKGIEFKFIPPRAPHFGGLWEAAVKSAKHLLVKEIGNVSLTYEELETVVIQIEGILNSRPITPMSSDPNDLSALTPGHFLIGEPLTAFPNPSMVEEKVTLLKRWKLVNYLKDEFWKRWTHEYLNELQHRTKWKSNSTNIRIGTMVIIKEDNLPSFQWPLGRITKTYEGPDGHIRVVDIRTATGIIRRPIHRLAPLFPEEAQDQSVKKTELQPSTENETFEHNTPSKRPKLNMVNFTTVMLTFLLCLPIVLCRFVEIKQFPNQPGIYFDDIGKTHISLTQWNLLVFYDLEPLKQDKANLINGTMLLQQMCDWSNYSKLCNNLVTQLTDVEHQFETENKLFQSKRTKRGAINLVGNLAHSLFGVLDSDYADKMSQTIKNLSENENYELDLIKNQTSIIDSTINIMQSSQTNTKKKFDDIDRVLNEIAKHIQGQENAIKHVKTQEASVLLGTHLTLLLTRITQTQTMILDALTNAQHGKISPRLLSPIQLTKEISKIRGHLPSATQFPVPQDDLLSMYKLMSVEAGLTKDHVLFKLSIPLIESYDFNIYKIMPIPAKVNGTFLTIEPSFNILAITSHGDSYYPMTTQQHSMCLKLNERRYICQFTSSIYHKGAEFGSCEVNFFNNESQRPCNIIELHTNLWIQLYNKNHWIFGVKRSTKVTAVCGSVIDHILLQGSGMLTLQPECIIKNEEITLHGQQNVTSFVSSSVVTYANISQLISINTMKPININNLMKPFQTELNELKTLQNRIKYEEIFELPKKVQTTTTHLYGILYPLLFILVIFASYTLVILYRRLRSSTVINNPPTPPPRNQARDFNVAI